MRGLEPLTSRMPCERSSQLSYIPVTEVHYTKFYLLWLVVHHGVVLFGGSNASFDEELINGNGYKEGNGQSNCQAYPE